MTKRITNRAGVTTWWHRYGHCRGRQPEFDIIDSDASVTSNSRYLTSYDRKVNHQRVQNAVPICMNCPVLMQCFNDIQYSKPLGVIRAGFAFKRPTSSETKAMRLKRAELERRLKIRDESNQCTA